jgi:hypothetical protein
LTVSFYNFNNVALVFPLEDGMSVLYPEASFTINVIRAFGILFCWLALLAAIGLAAGSLLSFPVAAFCAAGLLVVAFSTGTLRQIVAERGITGVNPNTGRIDEPGPLDHLSIVVSGGLVWVIDLVRDFSPIDSLSSGRSVSWGQLARAFFQVVVIMGGIFGSAGVVFFTRRELAAPQTG